jgi:hypothetical protein
MYTYVALLSSLGASDGPLRVLGASLMPASLLAAPGAGVLDRVQECFLSTPLSTSAWMVRLTSGADAISFALKLLGVALLCQLGPVVQWCYEGVQMHRMSLGVWQTQTLYVFLFPIATDSLLAFMIGPNAPRSDPQSGGVTQLWQNGVNSVPYVGAILACLLPVVGGVCVHAAMQDRVEERRADPPPPPLLSGSKLHEDESMLEWADRIGRCDEVSTVCIDRSLWPELMPLLWDAPVGKVVSPEGKGDELDVCVESARSRGLFALQPYFAEVRSLFRPLNQ